MKLKLYITDKIARILAGVKINRMEDRRAKSALMQDYLALRKVLKSAQEDKDEIARKFQEDWKEEFFTVERLIKANQPVIGHEEYLKAKSDAERAIQDLFGKEVEVTLTAVPFDALDDVSDDLTLEQVAALMDAGIIKE